VWVDPLEKSVIFCYNEKIDFTQKNKNMIDRQDDFDSEKHTQWAEQRAIALMANGKLKEAIDSMVSDLGKDPTRPEMQKGMIGMMGLSVRNDPQLDEKKVRDFIEGFSDRPKQAPAPFGVGRSEKPEIKKVVKSANSFPEQSPTALKTSKLESPEAERKNAEDFIDQFILKNDGLTPAAKELAVNKARADRGPWSVKDFVESVTQDGRTITINNNQGGASFLYLKEVE